MVHWPHFVPDVKAHVHSVTHYGSETRNIL